MNTSKNALPTPLIALTWRQRFVAHAFDEMMILVVSLPLSVGLWITRPTGMGWIFLAGWLAFRTLCHVCWHGLAWRESHATPGLWMFRAKVKTLAGAAPTPSHRRLLQRPAVALMARAGFFIALMMAITAVAPRGDWSALLWLWCWAEICVLLSTLLAPWKKGFSNTAPTKQDLATQSRAFVDRPQTVLGLTGRILMFFLVVVPFCLFISAMGERLLQAHASGAAPFHPKSSAWTSCGVVKQALNPQHDCRDPYF